MYLYKKDVRSQNNIKIKILNSSFLLQGYNWVLFLITGLSELLITLNVAILKEKTKTKANTKQQQQQEKLETVVRYRIV